MLGQTISHYRILEKLGQGGMGEVYLAEDTRLGHKVAIKKLPAHAVSDRDHRSRFEREARAVAHLVHPNILTLYEYDEIDGDLYFIMEYASGGSLGDVLDRHPDGIDVDRLMTWGLQAAEGLASAHDSGIVHRDIKPANLLLTADGNLRIADFGLARATTDTRITQTGAVVGTLAFMSPEQLAGREVGTESDIFALGATLHELLIARRRDKVGAAYAFADSSVSTLTSARTDVPVELAELLAAMLKKDLSERISSAAEVARQLREILERRKAGDTVSMPAARPHTRNRWRWIVSATAIVVLGAIGIRILGSTNNSEHFRTVAVLPLRDVSPGAAQPALAAGLTESIIGDLGRIGSISVISRRSAESIADKDLTMKEIGEVLGADVILDASILRIDDRLQVRATLVDADSDRNLWTTDFERELEDIIALQHDVALAVANGIRAELTADVTEEFENPRVVEAAAFERYAQARSLWRGRTRDGLLASISTYRDLVEQQPDFAEAWAGLADAMIVLPSYDAVTPRATYPEARRCALRAIEIDPQNAAAWNVMAEIAWTNDFDYEESERLRLHSLELNPSSATTRQWYGEFLTAVGRHEESLEQIGIAQRLDPLNPLMYTLEAATLVYARRFDEAITKLDEAQLKFPNSTLAHDQQVWVLRRADRQLDRAFAAHIERERRIGATPERLAELEHAYAEGGYPAVELMIRRDMLAEVSEGKYVRPRYLADSYASTQEVDSCLEWLERSFEDRDIALLRLNVNPRFDFLRGHPHFDELLRRINFVP